MASRGSSVTWMIIPLSFYRLIALSWLSHDGLKGLLGDVDVAVMFPLQPFENVALLAYHLDEADMVPHRVPNRSQGTSQGTSQVTGYLTGYLTGHRVPHLLAYHPRQAEQRTNSGARDERKAISE